MRRISRLVVAAVLCATSSLSMAAASEQPHVEDPCGDAGRMLELAGQPLLDNPDEERVAGFDIKAVRFADLDAEVQVVLELCGDVPDVELQGSNWDVSWTLTEDCGGRVSVQDFRREEDPTVVERVGYYSSTCTRPSALPPGDWWESYNRFRHELDETQFAIDGDRIIWTLPRDAFDGDAAADLTAGTTWRSPRAETRDGRRVTGGWAGNQDGSYDYYFAGPGAADSTWRSQGRDFVVGASG